MPHVRSQAMTDANKDSVEPYSLSELARFTEEVALAGHLLPPEDRLSALRMLATIVKFRDEAERLAGKCAQLEEDLARAKWERQ